MDQRNQILINEKAILKNIERITKVISPKPIYIVCKSDCYGLGMKNILKHKVIQNRVSGYCVADIDEAIKLRELGIESTILILGIVDFEINYELIKKYELEFIVPSLEALQNLPFNYVNKAHLSIDVGLGRIGIATMLEMETMENYLQEKELVLQGIYTHYSSNEYNVLETEQKRFIDFISAKSHHYNSIHSGSSNNLIMPDCPGDFFRVGAAIFGMCNKIHSKLLLEMVAELHSEISFTKRVKLGDTIGYNKFICPKNGCLANIPLGYGDGLSSRLSGFKVQVGKNIGVIASVCMNQTMIFLEDEVKLGDKVILIGDGSLCSNTLIDVSKYLSIHEDEFFCSLNSNIIRKIKG